MRKKLGFRDVVMWIAVYVAIGAALWVVPGLILDALGPGTTRRHVPKFVQQAAELSPLPTLIAWAAVCVVVARKHRSAILALLGPTLSLVAGGLLLGLVVDVFRLPLLGGMSQEAGRSLLFTLTSCMSLPLMLLTTSIVGVMIAEPIKPAGECPMCGYSMEGLPGKFCPECGAAVGKDSGNASMGARAQAR